MIHLETINNQTEEIDIPGIDHSHIAVLKDDLIKLNKRFGEMKIYEPRNYTECRKSLEFMIFFNKSITKEKFNALTDYEMNTLVLDGMVKRVFDHLENGEQLIKKVN